MNECAGVAAGGWWLGVRGVEVGAKVDNVVVACLPCALRCVRV